MMQTIAIVGGGFAGLTAAYELGKKGYQAFLFEQMEDLGGLARYVRPGQSVLLKPNMLRDILKVSPLHAGAEEETL